MRVLHPHTNTQPEDIQEVCVIEREKQWDGLSFLICSFTFSIMHSCIYKASLLEYTHIPQALNTVGFFLF